MTDHVGLTGKQKQPGFFLVVVATLYISTRSISIRSRSRSRSSSSRIRSSSNNHNDMVACPPAQQQRPPNAKRYYYHLSNSKSLLGFACLLGSSSFTKDYWTKHTSVMIGKCIPFRLESWRKTFNEFQSIVCSSPAQEGGGGSQQVRTVQLVVDIRRSTFHTHSGTYVPGTYRPVLYRKRSAFQDFGTRSTRSDVRGIPGLKRTGRVCNW